MSEMSGTGDPLGARAHARAQASTTVETMPILPAAAAPDWPADVNLDGVMWAETVAGGNYTALALARGTEIELTDVQGDAAASIVLFNALQTDERLNIADTVKVQWQAYPSAGSVLLSDRGRVLASILADSSASHDAFTGASIAVANEQRYGDGSPQGGSPAGRELLILAAAKFGLTPRDLPPSLGLFKGVRVGDDGAVELTAGAGAGASVRLRAELPLLLLIATAAHPLDPRPDYTVTPLRVRAWRSRATALGDEIAMATPEATRAFANTIAYADLRGIR